MVKHLPIALAAAGLISPAALAQEAPRPVKANTTAVVGTFVVYSPGCAAGAAPEPNVRERPMNGTVAFSVERIPFTQANHACSGTSMTGTVVRYTPAKGFRGPDRFTVDYLTESDDSGGRGSRSVTYVVAVQ